MLGVAHLDWGLGRRGAFWGGLAGKIGWRREDSPAGRQRQVIVVGHSHFIRALCQSFVSDELKAADPMAAKLCKEKLFNATCVAVDLEFGPLISAAQLKTEQYHHSKNICALRTTADPVVLGVQKMFEMKFAGEKDDEEPRATTDVLRKRTETEKLRRAQSERDCAKKSKGKGCCGGKLL